MRRQFSHTACGYHVACGGCADRQVSPFLSGGATLMSACWCKVSSAPKGSALAGEQVPQGIVVVLVKGSVYKRVEEGVGVAEPQEDAFPDGRDVTGAKWHDELRNEEGNPAKHEDADQNAHH